MLQKKFAENEISDEISDEKREETILNRVVAGVAKAEKVGRVTNILMMYRHTLQIVSPIFFDIF